MSSKEAPPTGESVQEEIKKPHTKADGKKLIHEYGKCFWGTAILYRKNISEIIGVVRLPSLHQCS